VCDGQALLSKSLVVRFDVIMYNVMQRNAAIYLKLSVAIARAKKQAQNDSSTKDRIT